jgi:hypothetical protein
MNTWQALVMATASPRTTGSSRSPKKTVADFRIPPHSRQAGSSSPASTRARASSIGPRAWHFVHTNSARAVQFEHLAGGHPGELVQPVDVLRDDPHGHAGLLQFGHGRCAAFGSAWSVRFLRRICQDRRRISGSPM